MRPHKQSNQARMKDLQDLIRVLGRAEAAPQKKEELVRTLKKAVRLLAEEPSKASRAG